MSFFDWLIKGLKLIEFKLLKEPRIKLPDWVKAKADRKFNKLLNQFKYSHHFRNPNKNELFRIIISASHITNRRRGIRAHWSRQKIRKYLLEKNDVVKDYKMR